MWQDSWQLKEKGRDNKLTLYILYLTRYLLRTRLDSYQALLPWQADFTGLRGRAKKALCFLGAVLKLAVCKESPGNLSQCRLLDPVFGDASHRVELQESVLYQASQATLLATLRPHSDLSSPVLPAGPGGKAWSCSEKNCRSAFEL